jgi:hypothetical protein
MGSVGGKTPTEPKLYLFFPLALGTLNHDRINVTCIIYSYYMGDKNKRMSMDIVF